MTQKGVSAIRYYHGEYMVYSLSDLTAQLAFNIFFYCYFFGRHYPRHVKTSQGMLMFLKCVLLCHKKPYIVWQYRPVIPAHWRLRQGDSQLGARLNYIASLCRKEGKRKRKKRRGMENRERKEAVVC